MAVYAALQNCPETFIAECRKLKADPAIFKEFRYNTGMDQALRYYYLNRIAWIGRVDFEGAPRRTPYTNPEGWNLVKGKTLENAAAALRGVRLTSMDFTDVLLDRYGKDVFIYCDPPYYRNLSMPKGDTQYEFNFTYEDHKRFQDVVENCLHRVMVSYDDVPEVREWAKRAKLRLEPLTWTYCNTSLAEKPTGQELLIFNY
jgi:DNA adenine methylase